MNTLIPWLFIPAFAAFWCVITYFLSFVAGWPQLRELYSLRGPFHAYSTVLSGRLGATSYGSSLIVGSDAVGLYLNVVVLFRFGAGPVLIPWSEIQVSSPGGWLFRYVTLEFPRAGTRLHISEKAANKLLVNRGVSV